MTAIELALAQFLDTNLNVTFYPGVIPQTVSQGVYSGTYSLIDSVPTHTLGLPSAVLRARFQISFFSYLYSDVCNGIVALRTALAGFKTPQVLGAFEDTVGDDYIIGDNDSDRGTHMKRIDVFVTYLA